MKKVFLKIWSVLKNYYVLATVVFIVWVGFLDTDNLMSQISQRKEMNGLLEQKKFYTEEIQRMKELSQSLKTDKEAMERYGRENYQMKKKSENIFLIVPPKSDTEEK
ncbi:MAG TPA: septum formation initiator family protein [Bacteroidales bacterium]|jgi:cell division protein FtsB|nr:septum formation initiator family protein [Bacteroidales bacterium]HPB26509.1 septum formation initiator family protein [Bacteroidales bacterium]HPI31481.1 septum formation initiator family protein [Bacteroidales bacterium]HQN17320.1 septum formation initiator family protein [Bacteroidales bacterium]HQP16829.1 septum formation initiator family protein [Bacteroidales bacterium]